MPTYEIRYLNKESAIAAKFRAACRDDIEAKALAHAIHIQMDAARQIAVWDGQRLIFTKPLNGTAQTEDAPVYDPANMAASLAPAAS
ncbi:MAG TPA: hypothetical protein VH000_05375 [Rhizomicrobium sp.]|jgi:hypothetical protein|nr:hypothetical protein [Rhizomicrobium sp.]HEX4533641.1 hypothetical protein [Rhizomicrobium sp.]